MGNGRLNASPSMPECIALHARMHHPPCQNASPSMPECITLHARMHHPPCQNASPSMPECIALHARMHRPPCQNASPSMPVLLPRAVSYIHAAKPHTECHKYVYSTPRPITHNQTSIAMYSICNVSVCLLPACYMCVCVYSFAVCTTKVV